MAEPVEEKNKQPAPIEVQPPKEEEEENPLEAEVKSLRAETMKMKKALASIAQKTEEMAKLREPAQRKKLAEEVADFLKSIGL